MILPWLFQDLKAGGKSGTAVFEQDKFIKKVYFGTGNVLFASSNIDEDQLAAFLLRHGTITQAQFGATFEIIKKTNKKPGTVLFELGILSPRELVGQVNLQVKQIILDLFKWRNGQYRFEEGHLAADEIIPLQMNTGSLILEGIQALDWQQIRKALPSTQTVLSPSTDPSLFQNSDLTEDQKNVMSFIDGNKNIEQVCSLSGLGDFNTLKIVHLLLALKIVEALKSHKEKPFEHEATCEVASIPRDKKEEAPAPAPTATRKMIQEAFDAMKQQDHFQVLGITNSAQPQDLKKAYFKLAKLYHPDRHFEPEMAAMKETLEALFSRMHEAYETLNDPEQRREYEQASAPKPAPGQYEEKHAEDYVENYAEKAKRAVSYFNAGMKEFKVGNFWGAAEAFGWAMRLDPLMASYYYYYGISLTHIPRRRHEAEENLQKAIEIDPLKPEYHLELGNLYLKSGVKAKALDIYTAALRENPNSEQLMAAIKAAGGEIP